MQQQLHGLVAECHGTLLCAGGVRSDGRVCHRRWIGRLEWVCGRRLPAVWLVCGVVSCRRPRLPRMALRPAPHPQQHTGAQGLQGRQGMWPSPARGRTPRGSTQPAKQQAEGQRCRGVGAAGEGQR
jgi:hypothetical protein